MLQVDSVQVTVTDGIVNIIAPLPESVNASYEPSYSRGKSRLRKSETAKAYAYLIQYCLNLSEVQAIDGLLEVTLTWYFKNMRRDIDNPIKLALDSMQKGVYENDNKIVDLHVYKRLVSGKEAPFCMMEVKRSPLTIDDLRDE